MNDRRKRRVDDYCIGTSLATGGFGGYANAIPKLKREIERRDKVAEQRQEKACL